MFVCTGVCAYTLTCVCTGVCVCVRARVCLHTRTHARARTHTHTHTHMPAVMTAAVFFFACSSAAISDATCVHMRVLVLAWIEM